MCTSSVSSPRAFLSSSPLAWCTFRFLRWSQTCSPPTMASFSFSQSQPMPSMMWVVCLELLWVEKQTQSGRLFVCLFVCFEMQLNEISARRLQSSSCTDTPFTVHSFQYTSSWSGLDFHSTCLHSVSCNHTRHTNGLLSELYTVNVKLYWNFPVNYCNFHFLKIY